ncbi:MAG: hypothetical protein ABI716_00110 [Candidatus Saccharibacteria bacterium]
MRGELNYAHSKTRSRLAWAVFYIVSLLIVIGGLYAVAFRIQTHSLPVGQVELSIPYSKYLVGEPITFTVKNNFNSPVYVLNKCPVEPLNVYRLENNRWLRIHDQAFKDDCPIESRQVTIPANSSVDGNFADWPNLFKTPGKYRVVAYVEYYNALPYQEFEVITKPVPPVAKPRATPASPPKSLTAPASPIITPPAQQPTPPPDPATDRGRTEPNDN